MSKILKFLAKSGVYLLIAATATATATGVGLQFSPNSADSFLTSSSKFATLFHGVLRSSRAISTIACTVVDYKYSLHGLPLDSGDYLRVLSEVHLRSAKRILKLCEANKGSKRILINSFFITGSVPCHFKAIKQVLISNLGQDLSEILFING
ncbi:hypothetical protein CMV_019120 [Castanea mollissima]|uniref:Uncharacterized protein n=1 Tax=Castanea mollissima TaxID=60419 RepID=A0A8J4R103_9ROSI|nr:hypothetical protein CMV_019120 [Castanea mollissima]